MRLIIIIMAFAIHASACGRNFLATAETRKDAGEDAAIALENNDPDKAITILENAIDDDPTNYRLVSLLAAAIGQKHGVDAISMALAMAEQNSSSGAEESGSSSPNGITALFSVLPPADDTTIEGINLAITTMTSIPEAERNRADNFYLCILNTAVLGLQTKKFDADGDGLISPVELLTLSDDDAISIIESLLNAESALANGIIPGSAGSEATAGGISNIKAQIEAQEGTSQAEKLRNYLNKDKDAAT